MEIRDGFILGIYNYCDSWCDRCAFTSHCRAFADIRKAEAMRDPNMAAVAMAPEHPSDASPPPPPWLQELLDEMDEAARNPSPDDYAPRELRDVPERDAIDDRAEAYSRLARTWLQDHESDGSPAAGEPRDVIAWFLMLIHAKAMRALHGLAEDDSSDRDSPADHNGSAKVALIGIDRSYAAWLDLVAADVASPTDAATFLEDLTWLRAALERTFPNARAFVRPGFDEPEEVARLWRECRSLDV
jgi:hypothetical protein